MRVNTIREQYTLSPVTGESWVRLGVWHVLGIRQQLQSILSWVGECSKYEGSRHRRRQRGPAPGDKHAKELEKIIKGLRLEFSGECLQANTRSWVQSQHREKKSIEMPAL